MKQDGYRIVSESTKILDKLNIIETPFGYDTMGIILGTIGYTGVYLYLKSRKAKATDPEIKEYYDLQMQLIKKYFGFIPGFFVGKFIGKQMSDKPSAGTIGGATGAIAGLVLTGTWSTAEEELRQKILNLRTKLEKEGKLKSNQKKEA